MIHSWLGPYFSHIVAWPGCGCTLTPPHWQMIRLCRGYQNHRVGKSTACVVVTSTVALYFNPTVSGAGSLSVRFRDACVEVSTTVASAYDPPVQRSWSPSSWTTIRLWWSFSRCRVTKRFGGDTLLSLPHNTYSDGDKISSHFIIIINSAGPLIVWWKQSIQDI